ncbi:MAG: hypothetical protein JXQ67_03390 [Campylobacterales bacterium]|nr:hypothetical protein [Campylobacterales bacterium]
MIKLLLLILPAIIFAQSFMISNIPLPKTYIQNLDPYECDEECLQNYLNDDMIFSFLAHAYRKLDNKSLDEIRVMNVSILNLGAFNPGAELKIALLLPYKKIGKYASSTTNAAFAYMMTKSHAFTLKSYKVESENIEDLQHTLEQIQNDGFAYAIAPLTIEGAQNIVTLDPEINIYFPTINAQDINSSSNYLLFGGIDYKQQSDMLLKEAVSPLVIFSDKSPTGSKLSAYQEERFLNPPLADENATSTLEEEPSIYASNTETVNVEEKPKVIQYSLSKRTTNLEYYLKENEDIINASFLINTPIIKSGMVMSQLTLYDANATNVLSTQINYDPLLLSMTQYVDRKDMIVANSLTQENNILIETNSLLGNDIVYDWINYTTTVGVDYFYNEITGEEREYHIAMQEKQMLYDIELLRPSLSRFIKYHPQRLKEGN